MRHMIHLQSHTAEDTKEERMSWLYARTRLKLVPCGPRIGSPKNRTDNTNMAEGCQNALSQKDASLPSEEVALHVNVIDH
jgi:hypothetical protein